MARLKGSPNWTIDQKAQAVAVLQTEANGCFREAERLTDVARDTLRAAAKDPRIAEIAEIKKKDLAQGFKSLTAKLLARYHEIADEATMDNKGSTLLGIVAEKALLYSDEPTQIVANATHARDIARELFAQFKAEGKSESEAVELARIGVQSAFEGVEFQAEWVN